MAPINPLINIHPKNAIYFAAFLVIYQFSTYIANDMIMPGMLAVTQSFHAPESMIPTSLTLYILGGASLQLILGPLSDRFGRRPIMIIGACIFLAFTTFIACSMSMTQFLIARFFQGMGLCFIGVVGYATLQEIFDELQAIRLTALLANVASLAPLLGPLAGAIFLNFFPWRGIFVIIAILAIIALYGLARYMPEPIGVTRNDGVIIHRISLQPKIITYNYRLLVCDPIFMLGSLAIGLLGIPSVAWIAIAPIILIGQAKLSVTGYALWQIPIFGGGFLGNIILRQLSYHYTIQKIIFIGSFISFFGTFLLFMLPVLFSTSYLYLMPGMIIYSIGIGIAIAPLTRHILFSTSVSKGTASAVMSMIGMCLNAAGVELANIAYFKHENITFGLLCSLMGTLYIICYYIQFIAMRSRNQKIAIENVLL